MANGITVPVVIGTVAVIKLSKHCPWLQTTCESRMLKLTMIQVETSLLMIVVAATGVYSAIANTGGQIGPVDVPGKR